MQRVAQMLKRKQKKGETLGFIHKQTSPRCNSVPKKQFSNVMDSLEHWILLYSSVKNLDSS